MKLRFEADLDYQHDAIEAVCDLFKGQETGRTEFTVAARPRPLTAQGEMFAGQALSSPADQGELGLEESALGVGNRLTLLDDEVLANLQAVQLRNALAPGSSLKGGDFTVEMETGTGKTYVYLRTVFELNRRYGFTKFVVVVPSVAIREGVAKTWEMTREHFRPLYAGAPADLFVYDSAKLGQVRDFAASATIKIMVATIGAFNRLDANVFYQPREQTGGEKPVDLIRATRPILIVDEPQSVDGGTDGAGRRALKEMHPMCTLRYSATHADKHHMVYRLDAIDAYERKLVKRIDVAGAEITGAHNTPYVKLLGVKLAKNRAPIARVEVRDAQGQPQTKMVFDGTDLRELSGRDVYADVTIREIRGGKGGEMIQLDVPGDVQWLRVGQAYGDVDRGGVVRQMIRRTIREHFDREKVLRPLGIKVLSLFFIDRVEHYRVYGSGGASTLGKYGLMFEEEYRALAKNPDYATLFSPGSLIDPERAHDGYFSRDKNNAVTELDFNAAGELKNARSREDAERGFKLIMREKERLLSEDEPLRFIFSHSALREGWDNPNVFQICSLREMGSPRERRQTIGRGLRLCVDSNGERRRDEGLNVLTVIADESYSAFADGLQRQIEEDLNIRFGVVAADAFAHLTYPTGDEGTEWAPMGAEESAALFQHLKAEGFLDAAGKVGDSLRRELKAGGPVLPTRFEAIAAGARALLLKLAGRLDIRNADDRRPIKLRREVYLSEQFRALWDTIKAKTTYRVAFDNGALIADAARRLAEAPPVARAQLRWRKAGLAIGEAGVTTGDETSSHFITVAAETVSLPDVLGELQDRTQLTRASLARILVDSGRLSDLRLNPAAFLAQAADLIGRAKSAALVDGVRYQRIGPDCFYAQELFESEELQGYLDRMVDVDHAPMEAIPFDSSTVERPFAEALDHNEAVKVFAKLPRWFTIPTPLGTYNPDWAVLVEEDGRRRLFFVVETKGSVLAEDLRPAEQAKVNCGRKHFEALAGDRPYAPRFIQARRLDDLLADAARASEAMRDTD